MKFVKGISLFLAGCIIGTVIGVRVTHFFYPGEQVQRTEEPQTFTEESATEETPEDISEEPTAEEVAFSPETLSVDTDYVLEETDLITGTVVETVWKLPDKYIGLNREQFVEAMKNYELFPPLSEMERGFVSLEVMSFSRERVVVRMNYQYVEPVVGFYLAVRNNEVVVYLEDMETLFMNTGIDVNTLPEDIRQELLQMIFVEDEETLYNFLENHSS